MVSLNSIPGIALILVLVGLTLSLLPTIIDFVAIDATGSAEKMSTKETKYIGADIVCSDDYFCLYEDGEIVRCITDETEFNSVC